MQTDRCLTPGRKGYSKIFAFNQILGRIFRRIFLGMIHGSGTSDVDLGASQKLLFFPSISSCGRETKAIRRCREIGSRKRRRNCLLLLVDWLFPTFSFGVERKSSRFFLPLFFSFSPSSFIIRSIVPRQHAKSRFNRVQTGVRAAAAVAVSVGATEF